MSRFNDAERALLRMAQALDMPPPPRAAVKAEQEAAEDYAERLALILLAALEGEITREQFIDRFSLAVRDELEAVYTEAVGGDPLRDLMERAVSESLQYVPGLADDIFSGKYPRREEADDKDEAKGIRIRGTMQRIRERFRGTIVGRALVWINERIRIRNVARTDIAPDLQLVWRLGATEKHCRDCLDANGRVMKAEEWKRLRAVGIHPQSPSLECGGWNCDCSLEIVS